MTTLAFTTPTDAWLDRLPLGNGRIGAMVGVTRAETRIGLNEAFAWSGSPASARRDAVDPAAAAAALASARARLDGGDPIGAEAELRVLQHRYAQAFLPVGEVVVVRDDDRDAGDAALRRSLDLRAGVHTARAGGLTGVTACPGDPDLLVHTVRSARPVDLAVRFETPLRVRGERVPMPGMREWALDLPADVAPAHEPGDPALTWDLPGVRPGGVVVAWRLRHDGSAESEGGIVTVRRATRLDVLVAIEPTVTTMGGEPGHLADARRRASARLAEAGDAEALLAAHRDRHRAGSAFRIELGRPTPSTATAWEVVDPLGTGTDAAATAPEALLGLLVEYGHHLLRASSRAGCAPANLQGIWNAELQPPWSSAYTLNINTPMNYWGAEATGASNAHLALLELLEALAHRGADTATRLYGARGWVAHHNTDLWGYALPTRGDASWSQWALGGAWLVRQFDEHRRYGAMSPQTLERYRPVVAGCARFLLDVLVDDGTGGLATSPSTSPENRFLTAAGPASLTRSSALDRALVGDVLDIAVAVLAASDPELVDEARAARGRLPGPRIGRDGAIAEWHGDPEAEDPRHRHLSHLFPWFPGDHTGDPAEQAAVRASLERRGDDSTGWSLAWKIALRARLRDAAGAGRLIELALRRVGESEGDAESRAAEHRGGLYPNLFAAHPPFQIDGNLGLVGAVLECLVQSHRPGCIDLLPAVPVVLETGRLRGAVARPGILLDIDWTAGRPDRVRLRARSAAQAGRYRVRAGDHHVDVVIDADADTVLIGAGLVVEPPPVAPHPDLPTPDRSIT